MCFNARYRIQVALKRAKRYSPEDIEYWKNVLKQYDEWFQVSGFTHPKTIIYENEKPYTPKNAVWGLVPEWAKSPESIWNKTLNARGETVFEKPAFRKAANETRCLIPIEGFYDYHHFKGKKYPFYISPKKDVPLYLAGLWTEWTDPASREILNTYSIVTTRANQLIAKIHNRPKFSNDPRMPVILPESLTDEWLKPLSKKELQELATFQFPDSELDAWTVRKLTGKESPGNVPEANEKYEYEELTPDDENQLKLFG